MDGYPISGSDVVRAMHGRQWRKEYQAALMSRAELTRLETKHALNAALARGSAKSLKIPGAVNWWC